MRAEFLKKSRIAPCWSEQFGIEAARENFQFRGIEATFDPALPIFFRVYKDGVELTIKPVHVTPCGAFEKAILGKDADVLREIGMINSARLQVEHLGCKQSRQSDRPRRTDDNFGKFFPLNVVEHSKDRREA